MTPAQTIRLRKAAAGATVGSTHDRAWRALCRAGLVRLVGRGPASYTALFEATDSGIARAEQLDMIGEAA